ncbi:DNA-directed RNA polymerase III subunit RPC9-like [Stegodyphus dumicola]|uniref:DNA-directed RNA polymerase III subunit RPC9-like n=1 Tax=Stegodyphus dumicola TaxID=202533 RepID=UPI0015AEC8A1|nr:DNA-directed RNA polymerase III subunit RPC9-like [Stegodyphus dumicola]
MKHQKAASTRKTVYNWHGRGEKLQLLNLRPSSLVEIQLLIEESEERFTEDQMNEILAVVTETLPPAPDTESKPPSEAEFDENC